eukprot:4031844-Amphidinium_carterae.1
MADIAGLVRSLFQSEAVQFMSCLRFCLVYMPVACCTIQASSKFLQNQTCPALARLVHPIFIFLQSAALCSAHPRTEISLRAGQTTHFLDVFWN